MQTTFMHFLLFLWMFLLPTPRRADDFRCSFATSKCFRSFTPDHIAVVFPPYLNYQCTTLLIGLWRNSFTYQTRGTSNTDNVQFLLNYSPMFLV
ncbi:hypothetical protein DL96DRAFT_738521 [Flagelloscypha sp. PMI_526]|nr:hypothetical protein DL96DRAFT_738521 [Flagelloscypha sp. PMI_526]